ncbi:Histone-lysine N-methyltransferase SETMAR [Habropoda laboriosa]|uniref:Histone-lysine N-methyltransferase SETMAR n=1 Tax=Habropoda laboriosa TaxID=597456 RepID=A0A0L7QZ72_9HYME|nr:Histone-lysine N-methyltransferase SETMAR [Habropoda laboriosa]
MLFHSNHTDHHSVDISPTDYHFFKHLKNFLTNALFGNEDIVKATFKELLNSNTNEFYEFEITKLVNRLEKYIELCGYHFD